jgi:hypothetical protein
LRSSKNLGFSPGLLLCLLAKNTVHRWELSLDKHFVRDGR